MSDHRTHEHDGVVAALTFWCEVCRRWVPNFQWDDHGHEDR